MIRAWKRVSFDLLAVIFVAVFAVLMFSQAANASNPTTVSFQGKVVNATGTNVADGSYGFVFKLYTVSSGGTAVWTESDTLSVTAGVFQVNLGAVCPFFIASACNGSTPIDFSASNSLYLGITFNSDPAGEMTPRVQLQSVPYAFYADNAGSLGGRAASGYVQLSPTSAQTGYINLIGGNSSINASGSGTTTIGGGSGSVTLGGASAGAISLQTGGTATISLQSANALNFTAGAASTWNFGSNTLAITSSKLTVDVSGNTTLGGTLTATLGGAANNIAVCSNGGLLSTCSNSFETTTGTDFIKNTASVQTSASFFIQPGSATVGGVIKANGADALDIQNSGGSVVAKVDSAGNLTAVGGTFSGQVADTLTLTASGSGILGNLTVQPASAPGSSSGYNATGGTATAAGSNINSNVIVRGLYGSAVNGSSSTLGTALGVFGQIFSGGNITNAVGVSGDVVNNGSGTFASAIGLQALTPSIFSTGAITSSYGLYAQAQKITGVTTGYGVYAAGASDLNFFAGNTAIGYTSPPTSLSNPLNVGTTGQFSVSSAGAVTAVGVNSGTGLLQGTGGLTVTGTASINGTGASNTTIGNTSGGTIALNAGSGGLTVTSPATNNTTFSDGTNILAKIVDAGTYGELQLGVKNTTGNDASQCAAAGDVGKIYVNSADKAVFACTASGAWEQLDAGRTSQTLNAATFTASTTNTLVDSVTITPTTANSDVLIRYNAEISLGCTGLGCTNPTVVVRLVRGTTCAGTVIDTQNHTATGLATTTLGDTYIDTSPTGAGVVNTYVICAQRTAGSGTITNTITGRSLIAQEVDLSGADYAETYYSAKGKIEPGTVVVSDTSIKAGVQPSSSRYQKGLMGVVSTQPGQVLSDQTNSGTPVILALAGRVPVKVSTENGSIAAGDYLTSSSTPGVAMKATKAGNVLGTALEDFDSDTAGSIMAFVGTSQSTGVLPLNADGSSMESQDLLANLLAGRAQPSQISDVSQVFADHIAASIDVVTPALISDSVQTNNIVIGKNGINFTDAAGKVVASIDNSGTFHGQMATPATTTSSTQAANNQVVVTEDGFSLNDPGGKTLISFDATGNASFSGDLNFASAVASGGLQIGGDLNVGGLSNFQKLATFFAKTIFRQDVEFQGHITVANDTAGYAHLQKGESSVHVRFAQAYDAPPVVTANSVDGQFLSLSVANITKDGFDIKLAAPASQDTTLDWTAVAVTNPQTATNPLPATDAASQ